MVRKNNLELSSSVLAYNPSGKRKRGRLKHFVEETKRKDGKSVNEMRSMQGIDSVKMFCQGPIFLCVIRCVLINIL